MSLARLFEYPGDDYHEIAREAAPEFARAIAGLAVTELQELFIQTFDMNPDCALDIGWHLFGENYDRGEFLVKMRQEMRRYGVPESSELPDHLTHVLPVLKRMPAAEAAEFREKFFAPALEKIRRALAGKDNPFERLLEAAVPQEVTQ